jgi:hypothetical protein
MFCQRFVPIIGAVLANESVRIDVNVAKIFSRGKFDVQPRAIALLAISTSMCGELVDIPAVGLVVRVVEFECFKRLDVGEKLPDAFAGAAEVEPGGLGPIIVNTDDAATELV